MVRFKKALMALPALIGLTVTLYLVSCVNNQVNRPMQTNTIFSKAIEDDESQNYGELVISFSSPVVALSDYDAMTNEITKKVKISIIPEVKGVWRAIDPKTIAYEYREKLRPSTRYVVNLNPSDIRDVDGKSVITYVNYNLLTGSQYFFDTPRIYIWSCYAKNKFLDTPVIVEFNSPVGISAIKEKVKIFSGFNSIGFSAGYMMITNILESNDVVLQILTTNFRSVYLKPNGLAPASSYTVSIPAGFNAIGGNLGLEKDYTSTFSTYYPLEYTQSQSSDYDYNSGQMKYYPYSTVYLSLNNELDTRVNLTNLITVTPPIKNLHFEYGSDSIQVWGDFAGATTYSISLKSGIKDIYGQTLSRDAVANIAFEHAPSYISAPFGYMVMENYIPALLPVKVCNLNQFDMKYYFISSLDEFARYLETDGSIDANRFKQKAKSKTYNVAPALDAFTGYKIDLAKLMEKNSGFMMYEITAKIASGEKTQGGMILYTDMGITVKSSPKKTLVFVRSLKDNTPVEGADVYLITVSDKIQSRVLKPVGKTDKDGLLEFNTEPNQDKPLIGASAKGSFCFNYGKEYYDDYYGDYSSGSLSKIIYWAYDWESANRTQMFAYTDRYLYKPGDKVNVKGVMRLRKNDNWSITDIEKYDNLDVTVKNSRSEAITNFKAQADSWGSVHYLISIPQNAPTGYYQVETKANDETQAIWYCDFRVEDYKPAQAEMKIIPKKETFSWGESFDADAIGWYLFGAPVLKPIKYSVEISPRYFYSKKYPEFSFSTLWDNYDYHRDYGFTLISKSMMPDATGKVAISVPLEKKSFFGDADISLNASTVLDDQSTVYGARYGLELFNPVHFGIKTGQFFVDKGGAAQIEVIALDKDENIAGGQTVTVEVEKNEWKSYQKAEVNGRLNWVTENVKTKVFRTTVQIGRQSFSVPLKEPGYYIARVKSFVRGNPTVSETPFYALGDGDLGWNIEDNYTIELETDKKEYQAGDTARVLVKNPFKKATALVTIEREKFHEIRQIEISGGIAVIPIQLKEEYIPNVYISVMLYTGRSGTNNIVNKADVAKPSYRMGYANLKITPKEKKLQVLIRSDKDKYEPGQTANVTVEVKDYQGRNVESEVTLAVADKGVLNLVAYQFPNLLDSFYESRPLTVYTSEMREFIYGQRYLAEKGEIIGGDGMMAKDERGMGKIAPRVNFQATPFYTDKLITTGGSPASFSFKLPDNLTAFKIMANAQTKDSKFGYGDSVISVSKPLMMLTSLPRFLRVGDKITAGAVVHNYTGKDQTVTVNITASEAVKFTSSATTNLKIANNDGKEVRFSFTVPKGNFNEATVTLRAQAEGFTDGVEEKMPILWPKIFETTALYNKTTEAKATEPLDITANIIPEMSKLNFTLAPTAFADLKGGIDYLLEYPYGCLEQKISRVLPLVLGEDVIVKYKLLEGSSKDDLRKTVQTVLDELDKFKGNNGFKTWSDDIDTYNPYLTVYASFLIALAKEKGYNVPADLANQAQNWTKEYADGGGYYNSRAWEYSKEYKALVQNFALYVASLNGYENEASLNRAYVALKEELKEDTVSRAFFLMTVAKYKTASSKAEYIDTISQELLKNARTEAATIYFTETKDWGWFFYNDTIITAITLKALLDAKVDFADSFKVINWLVSQRKAGAWISTHANALVFWSFNTYLEMFESGEPNFTANVKIGKDEVMNAMFSSRLNPVAQQSYDLKAGTSGKTDIVFSKNGSGTLYYFVRFRYILKNYPAKRDDGFSITKQYFNYDSGIEVKDNKFIRGTRYIVKVKVYTPKERHFVVLDDQLPSGFEPVNTDFATEANEKGITTGAASYSWWGDFDHTEIYRDRVYFTANLLRPGDHDLQYVVRATTTGYFGVPQTKAEEMYNPEVFGYISQPDVNVVDK